jgi:catechol 2,3-dioxygenase-like lactoylglutathione lyase family enzyme
VNGTLARMFDHVGLWVSDFAAAVRFYTTLLGREPEHADDELVEWQDLDVSPATGGRAVTRGLHVALAAASREEVDARWQAAIDAGYEGDGDPGPRHEYGPTYYGAFLLDPDGNSAEVVHREAVRRDGDVDHLWIRVADADASRAFYDTIADAAGFHRTDHEPGVHVHYSDGRAGLRLLTSDTPTPPVHIAFGASSREPVDAFHAAATAAGYRDNGTPGERPQYHPGYYGAFVLDPDGHNIEVVFHDR